jgi:hypothetical protein
MQRILLAVGVGPFVMELGPVDAFAGSGSRDPRSNATSLLRGGTRTIRGAERPPFSVDTVNF